MSISDSEFGRIRNKVLNISSNDYAAGISVDGSITASSGAYISGALNSTKIGINLGTNKQAVAPLSVGPDANQALINTSEVAQFANSGDAFVRITDLNGSLILGTSVGVGYLPFIGSYSDHDFYIRRYGELKLFLTSTSFNPVVDNSLSCGRSGNRWTQIWAANATIQTSDRNQKNSITQCDLGLNFIESLNPVSYKLNSRQTLVTSSVVGYDEYKNEIKEQIKIDLPGIRTHYGLIAQDVSSSLNGKDFGGYIYDSETDSHGLRYEEFISPLIKSIQELSEKIKYLEQKLSGSI